MWKSLRKEATRQWEWKQQKNNYAAKCESESEELQNKIKEEYS